MRRWWSGAGLLAVGLAWLITNRVLVALLPVSWGGPNIGGGFLVLIALAMAVVGVVVMIRAGLALRRRRPRPSRAARLVPIVGNGALLVGLVAATAWLPGDSEVNNGKVGVIVDADGAPVLVLEVCHGSIDAITIVGPNRGDEPNEQFAELHAAAPVTAPADVALLSPTAGWRGTPRSLPLDSQKFFIASATGDRNDLGQVDFTADDLAELAAEPPGTVQYSDYDTDVGEFVERRTSRSQFHDLAC